MHPSWFYCCSFANCDPTRLSAPDDWSLVFPFQLFAYLGRGNEMLWLVVAGSQPIAVHCISERWGWNAFNWVRSGVTVQ
jgi:hypothetical protein